MAHCRTKSCDFTGHSPREMHNHYQAYPDHKITAYTPKGEDTEAIPALSARRTYKRSTNSHDRPQSAFEQLHFLIEKFDAEIEQETSTIEKMKAEIEARAVRLHELKSARQALASATAPSIDPPGNVSDIMAEATH